MKVQLPHVVTIHEVDRRGVYQPRCQCGYRGPNTSEVRSHELAEQHIREYTRRKK